jgi:hypothetical protein
MSIEKLIGRPDDNLAVKPFVALLWELKNGNMKADDIIPNINKMLIEPMNVDEEIDVWEIVKKLDAAENKTDFLFGLLLTLGLSEYDKTIISATDLKTRYNLR